MLFWEGRGMWDLSSLIRDWTCTPCLGRPGPNPWTARQVSACLFLMTKYGTQKCQFVTVESYWTETQTQVSNLIRSWCSLIVFSHLLFLSLGFYVGYWFMGAVGSTQSRVPPRGGCPRLLRGSAPHFPPYTLLPCSHFCFFLLSLLLHVFLHPISLTEMIERF